MDCHILFPFPATALAFLAPAAEVCPCKEPRLNHGEQQGQELSAHLALLIPSVPSCDPKTAAGLQLTKVEPLFNRLTLFDPRFPHGVRMVEGTQDPARSRVVLHGWFTSPTPFFKGRRLDFRRAPALARLTYTLLQSLRGLLSRAPVLTQWGYSSCTILYAVPACCCRWTVRGGGHANLECHARASVCGISRGATCDWSSGASGQSWCTETGGSRRWMLQC